MPKLEYGTCRSIAEVEVQDVYVAVMADPEFNGDVICDTEEQTKAVIRRKLEAIAYKEYSGDCDYVDFINFHEGDV
jgi:hypothetical protein